MAKHRRDAETTSAELIVAARFYFTDVGYAQARTKEIVERTGLTRGALYHHFKSKQGLFVAVLEQVHAELAHEVAEHAVAAKGGPTESLRAGFHAWLDVALRDDVRQILLVDGPAVVGWEEWHRIDLEHGFGVTHSAIEAAMKAGEITKAPVDELTHVLLGALTQAGLELGRSSDPSNAKRNYHKIIDLLIDRLRI